MAGPNTVVSLESGHLTQFTVGPADAGLPTSPVDAISGGDAPYNAAALRRLLDGQPGPYRDTVLFNAAAGFIVAGKVDSLTNGVALAERTIDDGAARNALERLRRASAALES